MLKIRDLIFDNCDGTTGVIPDSDLYDDQTGKSIAVGKSIQEVLDKELADACDIDIKIIKREIYDVKIRVKNDPDFEKELLKKEGLF